MHFFDICNFQKSSDPEVFCHFLLGNVLRATTACTFSTSQLPKVVREWCVLYTFDFQMCFAPQRRALFPQLHFQKSSEADVFCTLLTSKCASRHNGVHFFHISTSKSGPSMRCFDTFYFKMCFAPQRRAIFHVSSGQLPPHPPL